MIVVLLLDYVSVRFSGDGHRNPVIGQGPGDKEDIYGPQTDLINSREDRRSGIPSTTVRDREELSLLP